MNTIKFANPSVFFLSIVIFVIVTALVVFSNQIKHSVQFSSISLLQGLNLGNQEWRLRLPIFLKGLALFTMLFALARPQRVGTHNQISAEVTDIMICLDASGSMASEDFQPNNRFGVAKEVGKNFVL